MSMPRLPGSLLSLLAAACGGSLEGPLDGPEAPIRPDGGAETESERGAATLPSADAGGLDAAAGTLGPTMNSPESSPGCEAQTEEGTNMIIINGNIVADGKDSVYTCTAKQIRGNGKLVNEARTVGTFSGVQISDRLQGWLQLGPHALTLTVDENLLPLIETSVRGGVLEIGNPDPTTTLAPSPGARIDITAPRLERIAALGSASLRGTSAGTTMALETSGAGLLELALTVDTALTATASGASRIQLTGTAPKVELIASGAANLVSELPSPDIAVTASGTAKVRVRANGKLRITASGAASVTVIGDPAERTVDKTGAASVTFKR